MNIFSIPSRKKCPIIKTHCYKKIQKCVFFWCNVCDFLNLSIFVREYRTKRPGASHSKERYVTTKPQTSHNNMKKTRPRYLNLKRKNNHPAHVSLSTIEINSIDFIGKHLDIPVFRPFVHVLSEMLKSKKEKVVIGVIHLCVTS